MRWSPLASPAERMILGLAGLYLPYSWLVLMDNPWDAYRWTWIRLWPILPGLFVLELPGLYPLPGDLGLLLAGLTATPILVFVVLLARRSRRSAVVVGAVVLVLSGANSWVAYQLFLF
jgi:hypothetical protein